MDGDAVPSLAGAAGDGESVTSGVRSDNGNAGLSSRVDGFVVEDVFLLVEEGVLEREAVFSGEVVKTELTRRLSSRISLSSFVICSG